MERFEKFYPNAKKYALKVNNLIEKGYWIIMFNERLMEDFDPFILREKLNINDEEKKISIKIGENSRQMIWGDGWNDSISQLKKSFQNSKKIHPKNLKDFKL